MSVTRAFVLALMTLLLLASAQAQDLNEIYKQFVLARQAGRYAEAELLGKQAVDVCASRFGQDKKQCGWTLNNLAIVYQVQGKYADAEGLYRRALAIMEKALGENHPDVAQTLNNLAVVYRAQGKYADAEGLYRRALAIREKALGENHSDVAQTLNNLAIVYQAQGKYADADGLYRRALAIKEKALGENHPDVAQVLNNLAGVYQAQGKYADAEGLYRRALAIREKALGENHPDVAQTLNNLALMYQAQGKYADAEGLYRRALAIREKALGENHSDVAQTLNNLANVYQAQGKYADAEGLYRRALAIMEKALGENHPDVALTLNNLSILKSSSRNVAEALAYSRRATAAVIAQGLAEAPAVEQSGQTGGLIEQRAEYFRFHVHNLALATSRGIEPAQALGREGFKIAQWALQSAAGAAVAQMAARFVGGGTLGGLVREQQDLAASWRAHNKALIDAVSKPDAQRNDAASDTIRKQMANIDVRLARNAARLEKEFPDYAALASPKPLTIDEAQNLLGPDEALVFFLTGTKESNETYVFALTRAGVSWKVTPFGADALAEKVAAFRRGLDLNELGRQIEIMKSTGKQPDVFDLALANELYSALFGPVEALIKDKKQLLIVPSGALTALPFDLLVTEKPTGGAPSLDNTGPYRDAAWLIKRQAVSVLPSVASLKALRGFGHKDEAPKPMVGFGDPVFNPNAPIASAEPSAPAAQKTAARSLTTRSYTDFWQGVGVDRDKLAQALPALPDTAVELRTVAQKLGVPASDIHLGRDASETTVKHVPLADYRIVYFATHGLVAGDIKGLAEPSLALSIPAQPTADDDGLLTASEVAQLKLNADWVVLSACNTIAGDKPGAEALSGLARAFFYAGARALLVSHWAVDSNAATRLTTSTFDILKIDPKLGRAEALRRAELAYLNDPSDPRNAYPAFWAPFEIVGEGAGR